MSKPNPIKALIESRKKYYFFADNPQIREIQSSFDNCALCDYCEEIDIGCKSCPMYNHWPRHSGLCSKCLTCSSVWDKYHDWEHYHDSRKVLDYDRAFFALILAEALQERIVQIYKQR